MIPFIFTCKERRRRERMGGWAGGEGRVRERERERFFSPYKAPIL
jgi:hypothetical protein